MAKMQAMGVDGSMSNFGMVHVEIDMDSLQMEIKAFQLIETESEKSKGIRKDSDDMRRAKEINRAMMKFYADSGAKLTFAEIPFFNPGGHPAANYNSGFVIAMLSSVPTPIIQVFPADVKMAAVGHRQASKEEMIDWATRKYPAAPWKLVKRKGAMVPTAKNEHLADATASVHAGLESDQFRQLQAMYQMKAA